MLVQQEQKLTRAEQTDDDIFVTLEARRKEWDNDLKELHSRITSNTQETTETTQTTPQPNVDKAQDEGRYQTFWGLILSISSLWVVNLKIGYLVVLEGG